MRKLFTFIIIGTPVFFIGYTVYNNIKTTIDTATALKLSISKVKWMGFQGDILHLLKVTFSVEITFKIENPTSSPITMDYINLELSILGKKFAVVNFTTPITIKAHSTLLQPLKVTSTPGGELVASVSSMFSSGKIPTAIHIKGTASANTWKAAIDSDYSVVDALSGSYIVKLLQWK